MGALWCCDRVWVAATSKWAKLEDTAKRKKKISLFKHSNQLEKKPSSWLVMLTQFMSLNVHVSFLELKLESGWWERLCSPTLGGGRSYHTARVAAGFTVVPVAAQVDLQRQQTVGRRTILAALIWDTRNMWCSSRWQISAVGQTINTVQPFQLQTDKPWHNWDLLKVTWWLSGAGLQGAGLFGHWFGEWVTASDQLPALVTFHISHPHTHTARLGALRTYRSASLTHNWGNGKHGVSVPCWPHLRPGGGVPFEAWPLKAGGLPFRFSQTASARLLIEHLELSSANAHTQDHPSLHAATASCVALWRKYFVLCCFSVLCCSASTHKCVKKHKGLLPSPTLGSASLEHSLSPHRGGWPEVCFQQHIGCREQRGPPGSYSTHDASSSLGHMTPSTATTQVKGQNQGVHLPSGQPFFCLGEQRICWIKVLEDWVWTHRVKNLTLKK